MVFSRYRGIKISGIAASVSGCACGIDTLMAGENEKTISKFKKNTGINSVFKSTDTQTAADFSVDAARTLEKAGKYAASEIGILINVTQTPDYRTPSTACVLQERLGLNKSCISFDVNLGCSGFVYGVSIGAALLQPSSSTKALVLIGDTLARGRITTDRNSTDESNTSYLFGDASAAVLLEKDESGNIDSALMTDGSGFKALVNPYGGWKHPIGPEHFPGDDIAVFNFAIGEVPNLIEDFMKAVDSDVKNFDALVLHQANMMIIKQIAKRVGMPMEKVPVSLDRFGNTSGASIPVTIVDQWGDDNVGKLRLLTSGFGVGLSWGCLSFEINKQDIIPMNTCEESYDDGFRV